MIWARAWIASGGAGEAFVNFDGIDNRGLFNVMAHRGGGPPRSAPGDGLPPRVQAALRARGQGVRRMPLPLGIFVDGSVLAAGGIPGATVSRGDWRTLQVVHTERDTPDRMDVSSALEAGRAAADAIRAHFG